MAIEMAGYIVWQGGVFETKSYVIWQISKYTFEIFLYGNATQNQLTDFIYTWISMLQGK
jgi:hypothetical protein